MILIKFWHARKKLNELLNTPHLKHRFNFGVRKNKGIIICKRKQLFKLHNAVCFQLLLFKVFSDKSEKIENDVEIVRNTWPWHMNGEKIHTLTNQNHTDVNNQPITFRHESLLWKKPTVWCTYGTWRGWKIEDYTV